ncbi:MAG: insulinase family protein [Sphingomonadales bacterium]|nr:insulinase family protein [Sphingomonadales bacterium]MDE2567667.1 insulinase family protein [Sphingomonadales bacterium]
MFLRRLAAALFPFLLAACAVSPHPAAPGPAARADWAFQHSDLKPDPAFRFGRLANGMRWIVRHNATPAGTVEVRMQVAAGSLDERDDERGFAHFVEHMAFKGSTRVPEGEMVRLLQRDGLAFGPDTNAQTSFETTTYMLSLPRSDTALLDTALMLMRETASELSFAPDALARERGVVLSEMRDNKGYQLSNLEDQLAFFYPDALYPKRLPIGLQSTLDAATSDSLKAFWHREYVPGKTTVVVIGDIDPASAEAAIAQHFDSWQAGPDVPRPAEGTVDRKQRGATDVHIDPALSERITVSRHGRWLDEPDSAATREENLLRRIGYGILNRRFQSMNRVADPPFRGAGFGTSEVFHIGRTTNLIVDTPDGHWQRGLEAAARAYWQAIDRGFSQAEVAEQVANIRTALQNAAAGEDTRSNRELAGNALALIGDDALVPTTPQSALDRFDGYAGRITPESVLAALRTEAVRLKDPLIRFQGRTPPKGGVAAIRSAWDKASRGHAAEVGQAAAGSWGYTDFGTPGTVVSDTVEPLLGIREVRFANGVRLNLKQTGLDKDEVLVRMSLDGGQMLDTRAEPLATEMMGMFNAGGTGKHSQDQIQTLLAGHAVGGSLNSGGDVFSASAATTPRDLDLEMQLLVAYVSDPGFRPEGEMLYRQNAANFFAQAHATPGGALGFDLPGILSDHDPRFSYHALSEYQALTFAKLRQAVAGRFAHGAIEIGIVGDIDEAAAIDAVAKTFGALPAREPDFRAWTDNRDKPFTGRRGMAVIRHTGDPSQAIIRYEWPTRDDSDAGENLALDLLQQVAQVEVTDTIREALGKAYSPGVRADQSSVWKGYGTFAIQAGVDVADVAATREALDKTIAGLIAAPVDADTLQRARAPLIEHLDNALKSNGGWLVLVSRAQSKPQYLDRWVKAKARLLALTPQDLQREAAKYLSLDKAVQAVVLPKGAEAPKD